MCLGLVAPSIGERLEGPIGTINNIEASENLFVLGESLRPLLTNAMGSSDW